MVFTGKTHPVHRLDFLCFPFSLKAEWNLSKHKVRSTSVCGHRTQDSLWTYWRWWKVSARVQVSRCCNTTDWHLDVNNLCRQCTSLLSIQVSKLTPRIICPHYFFMILTVMGKYCAWMSTGSSYQFILVVKYDVHQFFTAKCLSGSWAVESLQP